MGFSGRERNLPFGKRRIGLVSALCPGGRAGDFLLTRVGFQALSNDGVTFSAHGNKADVSPIESCLNAILLVYHEAPGIIGKS